MPDVAQIFREAAESHRQGLQVQAERLYREVLELVPEHAEALHLLGVLRAQHKDYAAAVSLIERAALHAPNDPTIQYNLANVLRDLGRLDDSLAAYARADALLPTRTLALTNRGAVLCALGRFEEALADFDLALTRDPCDAAVLTNRGNALVALDRNDEAVSCFDWALALRPNHADTWFGRGTALKNLGRLEAALTSYGRAVTLEPDHAEAFLQRGDVHYGQKRLPEALADYDKAIALNPGLAGAHQGRARTLFDLRRGKEAAAAFDTAFRLDPDADCLEGIRLLTKMYVCDWSDLAQEQNRLIAHVLEGKNAADPFAFLIADVGPQEQLACARIYAASKYPAKTPLWPGGRSAHPKIRLGYLSGEFREQATAYLTAGLFECHDRNAFELYAFSTGPEDDSAMRGRIKAAFAHFTDVAKRNDREIAAAIRDAEIDILINLSGYFGAERTGAVAFKPAPVQVNYLGFPGTMGAPYMDYILADRWIIPEDRQEFYTEKVVYLPDCYQANDRKKAIGENPGTRSGHGLPENGFVFACFNNAYKITPDIFDIWMRLLTKVESGVLWLLDVESAARRNLVKEAVKRGIAPDRVVFAPFTILKDHLARIRHADLFLDTLPVNAHTTASDALWAGVPVLTCPGRTFVSRVAASLNRAVGLGEMTVPSLAEYEALALRLARDPAALAAIRAKLARNRLTQPLFDTQRLTRHIETAYREIYERHARGDTPSGFSVGRT